MQGYQGFVTVMLHFFDFIDSHSFLKYNEINQRTRHLKRGERRDYDEKNDFWNFADECVAYE